MDHIENNQGLVYSEKHNNIYNMILSKNNPKYFYLLNAYTIPSFIKIDFYKLGSIRFYVSGNFYGELYTQAIKTKNENIKNFLYKIYDEHENYDCSFSTDMYMQDEYYVFRCY